MGFLSPDGVDDPNKDIKMVIRIVILFLVVPPLLGLMLLSIGGLFS